MRRGRTRRKLELPGLTIEVYPAAGKAPLLESSGADLLHRNIYLPSEARGLLENMDTTRGASKRVLSQEDIEARLDKILTIRGDFKLNDLRELARVVAGKLDMAAECKRLDGLIGALLGTHEEKKLRSKLALARAAGKPYCRYPRTHAAGAPVCGVPQELGRPGLQVDGCAPERGTRRRRPQLQNVGHASLLTNSVPTARA